MPSTPLTRAQIYAIRDRALAGHSAPRILRELNLPVALETVRRVIRRDSHREIGVGASERAFVSNRLTGESRTTGAPVASYARPYDPALEAQVAQAREVARAMKEAIKQGPPPDPFDLPEADEEGPTAEDLLAAHAPPQAALAPFESADELLDQMGTPADGQRA